MNSEKRKVKAVIERASDGTYSIYMDAEDMNYLVTGTGETAEEAINTFLGGYADTKQYYQDKGENFEEADFEFIYDMASFLSYFSKAFSLAGLSRITGINKGQLSHYMTGHRSPSRSTVEKIEKSVQSFAKDLSRVHFV